MVPLIKRLCLAIGVDHGKAYRGNLVHCVFRFCRRLVRLVFRLRSHAMRIELICLKTHNGAKRRAPWAAIIVPIYAGFMAFESIDDFIQWKAQR